MTKFYGVRLDTVLNAIDELQGDLDYLCSLVESPDPEFKIADAVVYAQTVTAISSHLNFMIEDISENALSDDEVHVKVSEEELLMMNNYMEATEDAVAILEVLCGISLQNN
jgi:hypothetical protein